MAKKHLGASPASPSDAVNKAYADALTYATPATPAANTATPDVTGRIVFVNLDNYNAATTITDFINGTQGQLLFVMGNANVTIANNSTIVTSTGANKPLTTGVLYLFIEYNGIWRELADATGSGGSSGPLNNFNAAGDPTVSSDSASGFATGSRWLNTLTGALFECVYATPNGAAVWARQTADVKIYTASSTWTKPAWVRKIDVVCIGSGGGGGSGARQATNAAASGGAGGGGGGFSQSSFPASEILSPVTVTVGAASPGGAARTTDTTSGVQGTPGSFSAFFPYLRAGAGGAGVGGGLASAATGGAGGLGQLSGSAGAGGTNGAAGTTAASGVGASGGGSGGGISTANAAFAGGAGGANFASAAAGGTAGTTNGGAGGAGTGQTGTAPVPGGGGGGGGSHITAAAGTGGNGGTYGAGGGGGGSSRNGFNSGAGGTGAAGLVIVISS